MSVDQRIDWSQIKNYPYIQTALNTEYNFDAISPGGSLIVGGNIVTLTTVPAGLVTGSEIRISGGSGTAEVVVVIVSGLNVSFTCVNTHSGAWTITSATAGIQEALNVNNTVWVSASCTIYGTIKLVSGKGIYGMPTKLITITQATINTDIIRIGDNSTAVLNVIVSGLTLTSNTSIWSSGYAINCLYAQRVEIRDVLIIAGTVSGSIIYRGMNFYRTIFCLVWNNFIHFSVDHGIVIRGQDVSNLSIDVNLCHNEFGNCGTNGSGHCIQIEDYSDGIEIRDCIFNSNINYGIYFASTALIGGVSVNYWISECDIEGEGIYINNVANVQVLDSWISNRTLPGINVGSGADVILIASNTFTGDGVALSPACILVNGGDTVIVGNQINGGGLSRPIAVEIGATATHTTIEGNQISIADKLISINILAAHTFITGNHFTIGNTLISGKGTSRLVQNNKGIDEVNSNFIATATTIAPLNPIVALTGSTTIQTITEPDNYSGPLTMIPTSNVSFGTSGNIGLAASGIAGKAIVFTKFGSLYYPSYS